MRTPIVIALLAASIAAAGPALADLGTPSQKAPGGADDAHLDLALTDPSTATFRLDQTWQGDRAAEMRQSLDAYFGNGDGHLDAAEVAKVTQAASHDLLNKTYPSVIVDGQPARVSAVTVTIDGTGANDSTTPLVIHHDVTLALEPGSGPSHSVAIMPSWNGTYALHAPPGQPFDGGQPTLEGAMASGAAITATSGATAQAQPGNATAPTPSPTPAPSAPTESTPQQVATMPKRTVPAAGLVPLVALAGALALLTRKARRR